MKFRFQESGVQRRTGVLEARNLEDAQAILERQGLFEPVIEPISKPSGENYPLFFGLVCLLGLVITLAFGSWRSSHAPVSLSRTSLTLHIEGQITTRQPLSDEILEIRFPELPTRLRGRWADIGDSSGHFILHEEIVAPGSSPSFFQVTLFDGAGEPLIKGKRFPYDAELSEEQTIALKIEARP